MTLYLMNPHGYEVDINVNSIDEAIEIMESKPTLDFRLVIGQRKYKVAPMVEMLAESSRMIPPKLLAASLALLNSLVVAALLSYLL